MFGVLVVLKRVRRLASTKNPLSSLFSAVRGMRLAPKMFVALPTLVLCSLSPVSHKISGVLFNLQDSSRCSAGSVYTRKACSPTASMLIYSMKARQTSCPLHRSSARKCFRTTAFSPNLYFWSAPRHWARGKLLVLGVLLRTLQLVATSKLYGQATVHRFLGRPINDFVQKDRGLIEKTLSMMRNKEMKFPKNCIATWAVYDSANEL